MSRQSLAVNSSCALIATVPAAELERSPLPARHLGTPADPPATHQSPAASVGTDVPHPARVQRRVETIAPRPEDLELAISAICIVGSGGHATAAIRDHVRNDQRGGEEEQAE